jgi:hypothetical protein
VEALASAASITLSVSVISCPGLRLSGSPRCSRAFVQPRWFVTRVSRSSRAFDVAPTSTSPPPTPITARPLWNIENLAPILSLSLSPTPRLGPPFDLCTRRRMTRRGAFLSSSSSSSSPGGREPSLNSPDLPPLLIYSFSVGSAEAAASRVAAPVHSLF